MVVWNYLIIYGYIFLEIFLTGLIFKKSKTEVSRKVIHILLFFVWVLLDLLFKNTIHQIIIPFTFIIINYLSYKFNVFKAIERKENNHLGTVYFGIAVFIVMTFCYFFPQYHIYSGIAVFCLTFGDGFAALIGTLIKSPKIRSSKSISGFLACFLFVFLSLIAFKYIYLPQLSVLYIFLIAIITAILELVGKGLDNFSVTIGTFLISILLINYSSTLQDVAIIVSVLIFLIVFFSKSITYYGSLLSMIIVYIFCYCGNIYSLIFLLVSYFISFIISIVRKKVFKKTSSHKEGRNIIQIGVNGSVGALCMVVYKFCNIELFYLVSLICIAGALVDSISSDIGSLSKKDPVDILGFKKIGKNLSGGITLLGTSTAALSSILLGLFVSMITNFDLIVFAVVSLLIFSQTIIDSILGSKFQVKYICKKCGLITEERIHCEEDTVLYSGVKFIDNNVVNLMSSLLTCFITILILGLI